MSNAELKFPVMENITESWDNLKIGNNYFSDDVWDLTFLKNNKRSGVHTGNYLKFKLLKNYPKTIEPIKRYLYLRLGQVKAITVAYDYNALVGKLIEFFEYKGIDSLEKFNTNIFLEFNLWLKRKQDDKNYQAKYMAKIAHTLYSIISLGQSFHFDNLPKEEIILDVSIFDWWGVNKEGRLTRQNGPKHRNMPLDIWKSIIDSAWKEQSVLQVFSTELNEGLLKINNAKFGILIQAHTGLRISEVLYLKKGCVEKDKDGQCWLTTFIEKTEDEPTLHKILIPENIYNLILDLEEITIPLRGEADENEYLFYTLRKQNTKFNGIQKRFKPVPLESGKWNWRNLTPFLERNNIPTSFLNDQNENIKITSHCFRHTFAKIAVTESSVNPVVLQTHFKHLSIEMTMHYLNTTKDELKQSYIDGMVQSDYIYTQGKDGEEFKAKINQVKTTHDINEVIKNISKIYGINPLPFGLCLYDFKRGHCPNLGVQSCYMIGCRDFVTNSTFLPNFEHEKSLLEDHICKCINNDQIIEVKKANYQLQKINHIIDSIKDEDVKK